MDNASVEEVAASLVREFLSRKGLKNTMIIMDQELPRSERSINNRNELRKLLNLESLYKQNKTNESPLKTALEIITRFFLEEFGKGSLPGMQDSASFVHHRKEVLQKGSESSAIDVYDISDNEDGGSTAVSNTSKTEISRPVEENSVRRTAGSMKSQSTNNTFPIAVVSSVSSSEGETKERQSIRKAQEEHMKFPDPLVEMKAGVTENLRLKSSRIVRGMAGPIASSQEDSLKKRSLRRPASATNIIPPKGDTRLRTTSEVPAENLQGPAAGFNEANTSAIQALNLGKDFAAKVLADSLTVSTKDRMRRVSLGTENATQNSTQKTVLENNGIEDTFRQKLSKTEIQERNTKSSFSHESSGDGQERRARGRRMEESQTSSQRMSFGSPSNLNEHRKQDIHLDDVDDELIPGEIEKIPAHFPSSRLKVESKAIDFSQAKEMKNLLFGSSLGCFSDEWKVQSFTFSEKPQLKYGIIQKKGGPCGVLAAVQGCVLQKLIFEESSDSRCSHVIKEKAFADSFECQPALLLERVSHGERCLKPSSPHRTNCLSMALADILWRAGTRDHAVVALHSGRQQFSPVGRYKADGILETLLLYTLTKYEDLTMFLQQNIHQFEMGPFGCILLTFSVVFSRSIDLVRADFDVPINSLIGAHGYCTQELVNLLLTGRAVSNVFNDVIELDSGNGNITVLKGIDVRSDIGFLSLFEHYDVCQVGSYLKTPKYPIWVVCSESHFSMLFCLRKELMNDWKMERRFDLYYYDGLAQQQEEIRLTVDTAAPYTEAKDEELVPPLEHCIRTKWKGARVDWNGTEPIL